MYIRVILASLLIITFSGYGKSLVDISPKEAYLIGKDLALHYKTDEAKKYLKYAADNGHVDAMLRYSKLVTGIKMYMPDEARHYMKMAASRGHEKAMVLLIRSPLSSDEERAYWRKKFFQKMQSYIDNNNADALYLAAFIQQGNDSEYEDALIKAVDAGSCDAEVDLAQFYNYGKGWFLTKGRRTSRTMSLLKNAADIGCPGSIFHYAYNLDLRYGVGSGKRQWKKLIEMGDANTLDFLGHWYADPKIQSFSSFHPSPDILRSVSYLDIFLKGFGRVSGLVKEGVTQKYYSLLDMRNAMYEELSEKQQKQVSDFVGAYLKTHDVKLSDTMWETKFK